MTRRNIKSKGFIIFLIIMCFLGAVSYKLYPTIKENTDFSSSPEEEAKAMEQANHKFEPEMKAGKPIINSKDSAISVGDGKTATIGRVFTASDNNELSKIKPEHLINHQIAITIREWDNKQSAVEQLRQLNDRLPTITLRAKGYLDVKYQVRGNFSSEVVRGFILTPVIAFQKPVVNVEYTLVSDNSSGKDGKWVVPENLTIKFNK